MTFQLTRIISGGQTGADQAGLRAATNMTILIAAWLKLAVRKAAEWLSQNEVKVLDRAGNCESRYPGICKFTEQILVKAIEIGRAEFA